MTEAIGIDLGTTYTVVAALEGGRPKIIPNAEGQRLTPSVVAFTREGKVLVGQMAKRQAAANPDRTVFSIKRRMGSDYVVPIGETQYTPQEISSFILRKVKADTEDWLGREVEKAVITVPAYFSDQQRQATKEAGIIAGWDVIRIISEPTAAVLAYALDREGIHTVLVWDLGGGTFDVSILEFEKGIFQVRAVSGNTWLGGDDFDQRLMDYLAGEYRQTNGVAFPTDGISQQRLREAAERAKIDLSVQPSTSVYLPFIEDGSSAPKHLQVALTRDKLEELTRNLLEKVVPPTRQALADAGLEPHDIDRVILVGGAPRMPAVVGLARKLFGKEIYQGLNPDEAVALGAAIQAGMLLGTVDRSILLDVLPLSLGVEAQGGLFARIMNRNTPLPASEARIFTTATDNQTSVNIHVLQGERELAVDNISLGKFELQGIPPLVRGMPKVEVAFDVDVDGIVHVSATDLLTENSASIKVVSSKGLRAEEIQRMISEAEVRAGADGEKRERIEAGIRAEALIAAAEAASREAYGCGREELARQIEGGVFALKQALATGQSDLILGQCEELRKLLEAIHRRILSG